MPTIAQPASTSTAPVTRRVSNLEEMRDYRLEKKSARAAGLPAPAIEVPLDPAIPARVKDILDAVDAMLPKLMKDKSLTLNKLFGTEKSYARGESTPWHKTIAGANVVAAAALAVEIAGHVTGIGDVITILAVAQASWKAAGAVAYPVHWALDNYDNFSNSFEFQVHHDHAAELAKWQPAMSTFEVGKGALPLLAATVLLNPGVAVGTAALTIIGGALLGPLTHKWEHAKKPPFFVELLQKAGIFGTKAEHMKHHAGDRSQLMEGEEPAAHIGSYDVLTGSLGGSVNEVFDGFDVARRMERAVWQATGVEPNAWKEYPELKAIWTAPASERPAIAHALRVERYQAAIDKADARGVIPERVARMREQLAELKATGPTGPTAPKTSPLMARLQQLTALPTKG